MDDIPALLTEYKRLFHLQIASDQAAWLLFANFVVRHYWYHIEILRKLQEWYPKFVVLRLRLICWYQYIHPHWVYVGRLVSTTDQISLDIVFVRKIRVTPAVKYQLKLQSIHRVGSCPHHTSALSPINILQIAWQSVGAAPRFTPGENTETFYLLPMIKFGNFWFHIWIERPQMSEEWWRNIKLIKHKMQG